MKEIVTSVDNPFFGKVYQCGMARNDEPSFDYALPEMIRSHELSLKISAKKPTDEDYRQLLCELFQEDIDKSVSIVSSFYCDNGSRVRLGKNITINKGATFLLAGIIEIEDDVLIGPDVKIATVNTITKIGITSSISRRPQSRKTPGFASERSFVQE